MNRALREEIIKIAPELNNQIFPTNAPEDHDGPYLVYARIKTNKEKTLDGFTGKEVLSFMFSVMAKSYGTMRSLTDKVEDFLTSIPGTKIGTEGIYIEDLTINNISETYEHELKINRGIIDFTIYY